MLFSSPVFLSFFLPLVIASYFLLPFRSLTLLVFSLAFYAWGEPTMVLLLVFVIVFNYCAGLVIGIDGDRRRSWLTVGILVNLSVLIVCKYAGFITANVNVALGDLGLTALPVPHIPNILGVSFFTFQAISYLVDVARGDVRPERNLIRMGVFKAFFPQLIAGPIVRYKEIAGDLRDRSVKVDDFCAGTERLTLGLGKKLLLADPLSIPVDYIFNTPATDLSSPLAWMGVASFGLQIYFDFSGYSDMAIGMAMMFGFRFPENFNMPYTAGSVQDFWRRWHMTLSRWFRDYLYIPLGGNRRGPLRTSVNLWVVFAITGFWHGANWTFLIWGLWHGLLLTIERTAFGTWLERCPSVVQRTYTITAVLIGWVWFRATSLDQALGYLHAMFLGGFTNGYNEILRLYNPFLLTVFISGAALSLFRFRSSTWLFGDRPTYGDGRDALAANNGQLVMRTVMLAAIGAAAFAASAASTLQAFLYFRF